MKQITVSLKDGELKALLKIIEVRNISCLHRTVKLAIKEYIERFKENELHHRMPDGKFVECKY